MPTRRGQDYLDKLSAINHTILLSLVRSISVESRVFTRGFRHLFDESMASIIVYQVIVLALFFPLVIHAVLPNGECSVRGYVCELDNDNLIGIIGDAASENECRQYCEDDSTGCGVYSYFGPAGVPYRDTCLLFSDCTILDECEDCFTEDLGQIWVLL